MTASVVRSGAVVRVPASSANLGPGFDALGMALGWYLEVSDEPLGDRGGAVPADDGHPAVRAFAALGGSGRLHVASTIPMGRGLGFSGAARVAGLVAACVQRDGGFDRADGAVRREILDRATELEGHADNVAASLLGGVVATAGGAAVRLRLGLDPAVVVWVPSAVTSTDRSRAALRAEVPRADAVFNVGRTALLVAALSIGDVDVLRTATQDRLHQDERFALAESSRLALGAALDAGAWCGWLSGSGPTVATLCSPERAAAVAAALPTEGAVRVVGIDGFGATVELSAGGWPA